MEIRDACILVCVCMQIIYCGRLSGLLQEFYERNNTMPYFKNACKDTTSSIYREYLRNTNNCKFNSAKHERNIQRNDRQFIFEIECMLKRNACLSKPIKLRTCMLLRLLNRFLQLHNSRSKGLPISQMRKPPANKILNGSPYYFIKRHTNNYNMRLAPTHIGIDNHPVEKQSSALILPPPMKKLQSNAEENIEVLLVVDNSIYMRFLRENDFSAEKSLVKMHQYYNYLFAMVNQRYETIDDKTFSIQIQVCDMLIAKSRRQVAWFEGIARWSKNHGNHVVSSTRALKRFQKWLKCANKALPSYDHAVFLTSYILCKRRKKVEGYAHVGTMCDVTSGKSSSIVHDGGDFLSAAVIAHELAHSLGVVHDGEGLASACSGSKNFVMAPFSIDDPAVATNAYHFSYCSVIQIKNFIKSSKSKCLLTAPKKLFNYDNDARFPGKTVDINSQCRFSFSESSSFCDAGSQRYSVCERLWCASPSEGGLCRTKSRLTALPGTPCGFGRHCNLGKCISSYTPTFMSAFQSVRVDSSLLFADRNCRAEPPKCSTLVRASPKLCTRERYQEYCCKSCSNPYTI